MLRELKLSNVGPAPSIELGFGNRLNLITDYNGLGKSFLLDIAWWAMMGKWPAEVNPRLTFGRIALPNEKRRDAIIDLEVLTVWNPEINYRRDNEDSAGRQDAYVFTPKEVWLQ